LACQECAAKKTGQKTLQIAGLLTQVNKPFLRSADVKQTGKIVSYCFVKFNETQFNVSLNCGQIEVSA